MSPPPAGPADPSRTRQYVDIFAYCLDECAATRAGPHELFLWNARRLGEAMLYALAEGTPWAAHPKPLQGRPMDLAELLRKLVGQGLIPSRLLGNLDTLRHCGNVAPLAQGPDTVAETATLEATRRAVVQVARWFYSESALQEPMPPQVAEALRDLESEQPRTPRHHRSEMELRRLRKALELAGAQTPPESPAAPAGTAPRLRWGWLAIAAAALAAGVALGMALESSRGGAPASSHAAVAGKLQPDPPAVAARREAVSPKGADAPEALAVAPAPPAVAAAGSASAADADAHAADADTADAETAADAAAAADNGHAADINVADAAEQAAAQAQAAGMAPAAAAAEEAPAKSPTRDGECPADAVAIPGRRLGFVQGPSPRPAWPQPAPEPPAQDVEAFCIDRASVTAAAFGAWLASRGPQGQPTAAQNKVNSAPRDQGDLPAQRVSWRQAQAYCQARGGDLPSVLQWEAALRHRTPPMLATGLGEWVLDAFPPAAFGYAAAAKSSQVMYFKEHLGGRPSSRKPLLSWQRGNGRGGPQLSFRCVWPHG